MAGVRDRIEERLGSDVGDPRWRDHVDELLYDGESVRESTSIDGSRLVVTSHRVMAFTPDLDGPNFQQVDRPNVVGVSAGADAERGLLFRGFRWMALGAVLVLAGFVIDMDAIVGQVALDGAGAGEIGVGGVLGMVQGMLDLLRQLDDLLGVFGALGMLLGVVALGAYLLTRKPRLVVEVAGDAQDVYLPRPAEDDRDVIARLERTIFRDGPTPEPDRNADPLREA